MRLPRVLWYVVWAWVWRDLPRSVWAKQAKTQAQDCEMYDGQNAAQLVLPFQRRVSIGVMPQGGVLVAEFALQSSSTGKFCKLFFVSKTVTSDCVIPLSKAAWPTEMFSEGDVTELWLEVDQGSGDATRPSWDLRVVGRRGRHRAHLLVPATDLQPPLTLHWQSRQNLQYYFNCVTGCLFQKSLDMPQGEHTFFLRHDEDFTRMTLDCGVIHFSNYQKELAINVTADELGPPGNLKKIEVVWSKQLGDIGILVDGVPVGDLIQYGPIESNRQVNVTVAEESGGLVAPCDPRFQEVASGGVEEETATTAEPSSSTLPPGAPDAPAAAHGDQQDHHDHASSWLHAVFTLVLLNFAVTVASIVLATFFLYRRSSAQTCQFSANGSGIPETLAKRSSTRSSTRSQKRGSQRQNKNQNEVSSPGDGKVCGSPGETRATSETVTTPLTTPASSSGPRLQKQLSTDEFVNLDLM